MPAPLTVAQGLVLTVLPSAVAFAFIIESRSLRASVLALTIPCAENAYLWAAYGSQRAGGESTRTSDIKWAIPALFFFLAVLLRFLQLYLIRQRGPHSEIERWKDFHPSGHDTVNVDGVDIARDINSEEATAGHLDDIEDFREEDAPRPTLFGWMATWR